VDAVSSKGAALQGIKVLDLSRILAGPWAGQILGDLGADVVKVERPGSGDDTRRWGPPWLPGAGGRPTDDAAYFFSANRNKRSLAIDISTAQGQALIRRLACEADVLLENSKAGGLRQYGLDADALLKLKPRLIVASITGFGQNGPYAQRAGYDLLIQGMGGLMSITGRSDSEEGAGPQKVGVALTDPGGLRGLDQGGFGRRALRFPVPHGDRARDRQSALCRPDDLPRHHDHSAHPDQDRQYRAGRAAGLSAARAPGRIALLSSCAASPSWPRAACLSRA
jgi:hypothetical protein